MQNISALIGSLCEQLAKSKEKLPEGILHLYNSRTKGCSPSIQKLRSLLRAEVSTFTKVFIIVDGLDEYPESHQSELYQISRSSNH
jgi:hypothetical protein